MTFTSVEQAYAYGKSKCHNDHKRSHLIRQAQTAREAQIIANKINTSRD